VTKISTILLNKNKAIGEKEPCFVIAEIGINHNGNLEIAKKMIDVACDCGVDAVKFQTFKAKDFISNNAQQYTYFSNKEKITESMIEMFERYEFSKKEWTDIINHCEKKEIMFLSTPQNKVDLDFLLEIVDLPLIKIGSDDLTNLSLLEYYALKNKPMIISTGMSYISEIEDAVITIKNTGNTQFAILHCVSSYPTLFEEVNLNKIITIKHAFRVPTGFSDHTIGSNASIAAVTMGAKIIEKHFTLNKSLQGPDHWFSSTPDELKELVVSIRNIEKAFGSFEVRPTIKEIEMRKIARRSIVAKKDIEIGEIITEECIDFKRPGTGIPPKLVDYIISRSCKSNIKKDELITLDKLN